jgi:hypothetical protein
MITIPLRRDLYLGHEFSGNAGAVPVVADADGGKLGMFGPAP